MEPVIQNFFNWLLEDNQNFEIGLNKFFLGFDTDNESLNKVLDIVTIIIKKYFFFKRSRAWGSPIDHYIYLD